MGGQWKYKINLISLEPEIIDTVNIYSLLNKTTNVLFKLDNKLKRSTNFKAYF